MLIIALVLAVIGLAALVFAVVTSNALVAWVCIGASALGVVLLIIDALRERRRRDTAPGEHAAEPDTADEDVADDAVEATYENFDADYPEDSDQTAQGASAALDDDQAERPAGEQTEADVLGDDRNGR